MSSADSSSSGALSSLSSRRALGYPKTHMEIQLDNHFQAKVYTAGDAITGTVTIAPQRDIAFDLFEVVLSGVAHTRLDSISSPVESSHVFLKLFMPIPESAYPVPRRLEASQAYTLPFHFVVPHHLTLSACSHRVDAPHVSDHHLMLPPTLGGFGNASGTSGSGGVTAVWERDDMAPDMARVEYAIKARVYREDAGADGPGKPVHTKIVEATHPLRILPASLVDPPPAVTAKDRAYKLHAAKALRKGLFARTRLGTVTARAGDDAGGAPLPAPFVVRPDGIASSKTTAVVSLVFDPARHDVREPVVTNVGAKLTAHTHFSAGAIASFPDRGDWARTDNNLGRERRGTFAKSVALAANAVRDFHWEPVVDAGRRDSGYCSSDSNDDGPRSPRSPSSSGGASKEPAGIVYAARLELGLQLPMHKRTFLPTFHSCILSRTYSLQVSITMAPRSSSSSSSKSPSPSGASTTITLSLPVQVVVGDDDGGRRLDGSKESPPSFDDAVEEADADAFLRPRVLGVPDTQYQETSTLPGYAR